MSTPPRLTGSDFSGNTAQSLIHLYRGEVGRMTAYRVRLDTSTNWAIITTAALLSYAFSKEGTHVVILFAMLLNYFFLHVEARRFRSFEIAHLRVRLLERFFYPAMLGEATDAAWREYMIRELHRPHVPIDRLQALGWRLRHNYIWIYLGLLVAWFAKLDVTQVRWTDTGLMGYVNLARLEFLPGWAVLSVVLVAYVLLGVLAWRAPSYPLEMD